MFFLGVILCATAIATGVMADILREPVILHPRLGVSGFGLQGLFSASGLDGLAVAILVVFFFLFFGIAFSFGLVLLGFFLRRGGVDTLSITRNLDRHAPVGPQARTAVIFPVYHENACRVSSAMEAMVESLGGLDAAPLFDFFILSDSTDPDKCLEEEIAWGHLARRTGGLGRIFYRRRLVRRNRKSGNVADFCRRWGSFYRYMIVLDADSVMTGEALWALVRLMEKNPRAGIIQSAPVLVNRQSLFARIQQFANRLYGPIFASGLNFWQRGCGNYWGHNAIIRVEPFTRFCALPRLSRRLPFGGSILSHDFVEAALMRRAGYEVWLAYDIPGSYEESPPTITDYAVRDRRWCQGNFQHLRLLLHRGLHLISRWHMVNGVMSYLAAPLWLTFLLLSTLYALSRFGQELPPVMNAAQKQQEGLWLLMATVVILFGPKVLAVARSLLNPAFARSMGGRRKIAASALRETLFSILAAPVFMMFHTEYVISTLLGIKVGWGRQKREDEPTSWGEAISVHGLTTLLGLVWGGITYAMVPWFFWWFSPVAAGWVLSIPLSVYSSRESLGKKARARKLFLIPEETSPPLPLARLEELTGTQALLPSCPLPKEFGGRFAEALLDPALGAVHACLWPWREDARGKRGLRLRALAEKIILEPEKLGGEEKTAFLDNGFWFDDTQRRLWLGEGKGFWQEALGLFAEKARARPEEAMSPEAFLIDENSKKNENTPISAKTR